MADRPKVLGDGILFLLAFSALLILFLTVGSAIQGNIVKPVDIEGEIHKHNSSNSSELIQMDHVYQGCIQDSFKAWNPENASYLEKGLQYRVTSYQDCKVNVTNYQNDKVAFSYKYKIKDTESTTGIDILTTISKTFTYGIMPIAFLVIFILFAPRMIKYVKRGNVA